MNNQILKPTHPHHLPELLRHHELVVDGIVRDSMHGPAQQAPLPVHLPNRLCCIFRQPGEHRNLRMSHSIRNQDLLALSVVRDGMRIPESRHGLIGRRAPDHTQGRYIPVRVRIVHRGGVVSEIGRP